MLGQQELVTRWKQFGVHHDFLMECELSRCPVDVRVVGSTALAIELLATNRTAAMTVRRPARSEAVPNEMNEQESVVIRVQ